MPLEKYKKECDVVKVTLVQGFCSLKITITQFWNPLGCAQKEDFQENVELSLRVQ